MFEPLPRILLGLLTGFLFGFLLQKGRVSDRRVIVGQFLLRDFTVMKVMLTAIIVGGVGVYAMHAAGLTKLFVKPAQLVAIPVGGLIFGVGMVLLGYCPGTVVAAASSGKMDALFGGMLVMLAGAGLFAAWYPRLEKSILNKGSFGERTLPEILNICPWRMIIVIEALVLGLFFWLERKGL